MRVIGTAGHVDHGKSTLVKALTGINPDRLREEQEREMTIELGFAWMTLPGEMEVGIVDVPGHRDFIENMLAGVGSIDAVVLVIAADEGVMPQTREHLAILDLLQIQSGIVALTKIDLIDDSAWMDLVKNDIQAVLQETVLKDAQMIPVSARTGMGLDELRNNLAQLLADTPQRPDLNRPRLSVDRAFTLSGFGTVITGTLLDGSFHLGDEVVLLPQEIKTRIRGLQTHKRKVQTAHPGSRVALNITGVDLDQVKRGDVLAQPGKYQPSCRVDAQIRLLPDATATLQHNQEMKFFIGATEALARVRILGKEEIKPGETGWVQLEFKIPVVSVRGDRYILRRPSPGETIGGGIILDPHPGKRHKRFQVDVLERLAALTQGNPEDLLLQAALSIGLSTQKMLLENLHLDEETALDALNKLVRSKQLVYLNENTGTNSDNLIIAASSLQSLFQRAQDDIRNYHQTFPLRHGMPREELKSRLKLAQREFIALISFWLLSGGLKGKAAWLALPEHQVKYSAVQQQKITMLLNKFEVAPFSPPSMNDCLEEVGLDVVNALLEDETLIKTTEDVVFRTKDLKKMKDWVATIIHEQGMVTVANFRDHFQTSRKYALAVLEYLDRIGFTVRQGDNRRLAEK